MSDEVVVLSTKYQFEEFLESTIWKDLQSELKNYLEALASDYDDVSDLLNLGKIQGRREAFQFLLGLPEAFIEYLTQKSEADNSIQNLNRGTQEEEGEE